MNKEACIENGFRNLDIFVGDNLRTFMGRVKEMKFTRDISVGIIA